MGLSRGQGTADGDLMARAFAAEGVAGRNRVQLELLEGEELGEATAGLGFLRNLPKIDPSASPSSDTHSADLSRSFSLLGIRPFAQRWFLVRPRRVGDSHLSFALDS